MHATRPAQLGFAFGVIPMRPDDVDLQILRQKHGWSLARLWINGTPREFAMTHLFGDPLEALARSAAGLTPTLDSVSFDWQDEPGCYRWTFDRVQAHHNLFATQVALYRKIEPTEHDEPLESVTFTVDYRFWKTLVYVELMKIATLLRYTPYRNERCSETFPHLEFRALERQIAEPIQSSEPL